MSKRILAENIALLDRRFPHIRFFLSFAEPPHQHKAEKEFQPRIKKDTEAVYVYGLGRGESFFSCREWLSRSEKHRLIFIEDEIEAFFPFLEQHSAKEILAHPQVNIKYFTDITRVVEECTTESITPFFEIGCLESKLKTFPELKELLHRKMGSYHALNVEALFSPMLFNNVQANLLRLPEAAFVNSLSNAFHQIPAVICGAGPSLSLVKEELKRLHHKAILIGGGSTLAGLNHLGIEADIGFAFDPNPDEYERMRSNHAFMTPLFYGNRVLPDIFLLSNSLPGYIKSETGGMFEAYIEDKLGLDGATIGTDLGNEAFSVTTMAIATAVHMGCNPIILCGIDLAFTSERLYCDGVVSHNSSSLLPDSTHVLEQPLYLNEHHSNVKWMMESKTISNYALKHPEVEFINATEKGIGFASILYQPLRSVIDERLKDCIDIQGVIYSRLAQKLDEKASREKIGLLYQEIRESLCRVREHVLEILSLLEHDPENRGKIILLEMEMESEIAYPLLIKKTKRAYQTYIQERHLHFTPIQKEIAVYQECLRIILDMLRVCS